MGGYGQIWVYRVKEAVIAAFGFNSLSRIILQGFLDTKELVKVKQKRCIWCIDQRVTPT